MKNYRATSNQSFDSQYQGGDSLKSKVGSARKNESEEAGAGDFFRSICCCIRKAKSDQANDHTQHKWSQMNEH